MRLGALLTPADGPNPHHLVEEAKAIEAAGFDSLWSAHAMGRGFMMHDPLTALAAAAAVTCRVELGSAILQLPIYHPTDIALKVLTLQQIAGGRLLLGAATEFDGWIASGMHRSPEECAAALATYRQAGGGRAVVSTILVTAETDLSALKERLQGYQDAGFDDAVVMIYAGGPTLEQVRSLV